MKTHPPIEMTTTNVEKRAIERELTNRPSGLKTPPWQHMTIEDRLLHACLCAYRRHVIMDDVIGWEELGSILDDALVNAVGDKMFGAWVAKKWQGDPHRKLKHPAIFKTR